MLQRTACYRCKAGETGTLLRLTGGNDGRRTFNVLFLCTGSSARSIMAEAILASLGHRKFNTFSAASHPTGTVHPRALELLETNRLPTKGLRSKNWEEFARPGASFMHFVFTVCDRAAAEPCPVWPGNTACTTQISSSTFTGLRFHPIEILLSMGIKLAAVAALGPLAAAVLVFEVLLNATSMFNHGNVRIPANVDRALRWFVVTPDMHRVHHLMRPDETNSNFGFNLPWWDRLLGTYRAQPKDGHEGMTIGIEQFRTRRDLWLDRMLIQPVLGLASSYPMKRDGDMNPTGHWNIPRDQLGSLPDGSKIARLPHGPITGQKPSALRRSHGHVNEREEVH